MESQLTQLWYEERQAASLLQPLAWLYGAVTRVRSRAYERGMLTSVHPGRPTVVVGNLTVGGTGKTPLVAWLASQLMKRNMNVGIASRGYGGRGGSAPRVVDGSDTWEQFGDEPVLLQRRTGCITVVGKDRVAAARMLVEKGVDVILTDDGLQHLRLARDCEIVVVDGARGFGNGRLLPAGPLREKVERGGRADAIVINGAPTHPSLSQLKRFATPAFQMELAMGDAVPLVSDGDRRPLATFTGQRVHSVAGIGNPERFFRQLRSLGMDVVEHPFPDHHPFSPGDLVFGDDLPVLMTEKDAVKCSAFARQGVYYIPVTAQFSDADAEALLARVVSKLRMH